LPSSRGANGVGTSGILRGNNNAAINNPKNKNMRREDHYTGGCLKPADLPPQGVTWTITEMDDEQIGWEPNLDPVLSFEESGKKLVVKEHHWNALWDLLGGSDSSEWAGKRIKLIPTEITVNRGTKKIEVIRIEAADPFEPADPADPAKQEKRQPTLRRKPAAAESSLMRSSLDNDAEKRAALAAAKTSNGEERSPFEP
jgi:hypothetical protein